MTTVKELYHYLDSVAPFKYQEEYDNAGIIVGNPDMPIQNVLVALDSTESVILEAVSRGCNVVVAHHPILFRGIKRLNYQHYIDKTIIAAIKHDIAIVAIHTNLDNVLVNGVNQEIANKLNLVNTTILLPKQAVEGRSIGSGILGELAAGQNPIAFLQFVKETMQCGTIKYTDLCKDQIKKVAICGGSGYFLLQAAKQQEADIYITSDIKYHEFFEANSEIILADIGHYESEQYTIELLARLISEKFSNFAAHCTKENTNPVNYL